ncbi:MAG: PadR family transcriptional regulator [Candidatus Lokiarchaeia archaeon]
MPKVDRSKYAVLALLSYSPMSGYDMKKYMDLSLSHFWNEEYKQIYASLKKLQKLNLVEKKTVESEKRPDKNVYYITDKGREEFIKWLKKPAEEPNLRDEFLFKLFFGALVPIEESENKIKADMTRKQKLIQKLDRIEKVINTQYSEDEHKLYWLMVIDYGRSQAQANIEWCKKWLKNIEQIHERMD